MQGKYASSTSANESESKITDSTSSVTSGSGTSKETKAENENLTSNNSNTSNLNETETYERNKTGFDNRKTNAELVFEYRKNLVNVYERIIDDLNPLFFALF